MTSSWLQVELDGHLRRLQDLGWNASDARKVCARALRQLGSEPSSYDRWGNFRPRREALQRAVDEARTTRD